MKSKSKNKTQQTDTRTYDYKAPPVTAHQQQYEQGINKAFDTPDPTIGFMAGAQRHRLKNRFDNPWGQDYSPEVREASLYAGEQEIDQATGALMRADEWNRKQGKLTHQGALAGMTAPQLVQTSGTMHSTSEGSQTQPWGPAVIGAAGAATGGLLA